MSNEPVAWMDDFGNVFEMENQFFHIPLYAHPAKTEDEGKVCARCGAIAYDPVITQTAKTLTDEDIAKVVYELNQRANTPQRWVTAMQIGAETIIQLRDELAILRKAIEK